MALESIRQKNIYRGVNSSKEFNERNQSIIKDMRGLYDQLNENEKDIEGNMDVVLRENFFLQNELARLKQTVQKLNGLVEEQTASDGTNDYISSVFRQDFYTTDAIINGQENKASYIDRTHGLITPKPTDTTSKFSYTTDSGVVFLPSGLEVFVKEAKNTVFDSNGELVYYDLDASETDAIVDKDKNTFWIRNVSFDESDAVTEVFGETHIKLPTKGLNNLYANALTIHPYPEGSMRIRDIQYKGFGDQWSRLANYPTELINGIEVPVVLDNARKLFFQFARSEMTEIRIFYSQPYWFENEGLSTFSYGFQGIDLQYRIYTEKTCEFVSVLDISDKSATLKSVGYPETIAAAGSTSNLTNLVEHHLYYDETLETEFDFNNSMMASLSKVYIKTVLKKEGDVVPVLKELRIPYSFEENIDTTA